MHWAKNVNKTLSGISRCTKTAFRSIKILSGQKAILVIFYFFRMRERQDSYPHILLHLFKSDDFSCVKTIYFHFEYRWYLHIVKNFEIKLSIPVLKTWVCCVRDSNTQPLTCYCLLKTNRQERILDWLY